MPRKPTTPAPATVGSRLFKARKAAGLTQAQLAAKASVHVDTVSRVERDQWSPTVEVLVRLAAACGVPAAELLPEGPVAPSKP